jgi:RNA polymerase sigma-70 factor (ECF subfamily)
MEVGMTPGASLDRRAEVRLSVCEQVTLFIGRAEVSTPVELIDISPCGFHVRCSAASLPLAAVRSLQRGSETARVRAVWSREGSNGDEAGLLREEIYLIRCLRSGSRESLLQLVSPYSRSVQGVLRSILRNREDSEDVFQECLLKVMARIDQFHPGNSFRAWLVQIATNEALKYVRDNRKHRHSILDDLGLDEEEAFAACADPRQSPFADLERKEFQSELAEAIESLDEIYRRPFVMRDLEHLGMGEIAARLGINVDTANTRLHRARKRLRQMLGPNYRPPGPES